MTIVEPPVPAPAPAARQPEDDNQFEPRQAAAENPLLLPDPAPPPPPPIEEMHASIPGATATTAIAMPGTPPMRRAEEPSQRSTDPSSATGFNSKHTREKSQGAGTNRRTKKTGRP